MTSDMENIIAKQYYPNQKYPLPPVTNPAGLDNVMSIDYSKTPEWVKLKDGEIIIDEPPKTGTYDIFVNWEADTGGFVGQYFGTSVDMMQGEEFNGDFDFKVAVTKLGKKVTMSEGPQTLSHVGFKFSEPV